MLCVFSVQPIWHPPVSDLAAELVVFTGFIAALVSTLALK